MSGNSESPERSEEEKLLFSEEEKMSGTEDDSKTVSHQVALKRFC